MTELTLAGIKSRNTDELTIDVTISERIEIGEDTISLTFVRQDGEEFPPWSPGAHIDLHLGKMPDGDPLVRQYSLWSDPQDRRRISVGVLKDPNSRGGSLRVHETMHIGTDLRITGPRNHFMLGQADSYILFAGGIGITPIISMARELERQAQDWKLYYLARSRDRLSLLEELATLPASKVLLHADDELGMFDTGAVISELGERCAVYACGPGPLLDALDKQVAAHSGPTFHCERFVATAAPAGRIDLPFEVRLARSNKRLTVPADKSCLQVLRDSGVKVDWSCKEGTCGTCELEILDGIPEHRDAVLTAEERIANETMMVCVSRARSASITLDI